MPIIQRTRLEQIAAAVTRALVVRAEEVQARDLRNLTVIVNFDEQTGLPQSVLVRTEAKLLLNSKP